VREYDYLQDLNEAKSSAKVTFGPRSIGIIVTPWICRRRKTCDPNCWLVPRPVNSLPLSQVNSVALLGMTIFHAVQSILFPTADSEASVPFLAAIYQSMSQESGGTGTAAERFFTESGKVAMRTKRRTDDSPSAKKVELRRVLG